MSRTLKLPRSAFLALALFTVTACDDSDAPQPVAQVRFLHASGRRAAVDFRADGTTRGAGLTYGAAFSNGVVLNAGARTFTARLTGATTDIATTARTLANSGAYSVVLAKRPTSDTLLVFADTSVTPATGKVFIRTLNVAPAAGAVDLYITGATTDLATATPQVTGIEFLKASRYVEMDAGTYRVRLTTTGTKTVVLDVNTIAVPGRATRSIAVIDANAGGAPLKSVVANERN
jgi:Domain of unknown function (DUF4397)